MQDPELPRKPDSILSSSQEDLEVELASSPPPPASVPASAPARHPDTRQFSGEAVVDEEIRPGHKGRVYFRSTWWFARCDSDIVLAPEERVEVIGLETESMTLLVAPYGEKKAEVKTVVLERDSVLTPQPEPN